ncbi:MAG TPA: peroxiredoxin [Bryobacteraceae bacterium]|nr:peroxiredoxin [Bryobacteraceae bacterium]
MISALFSDPLPVGIPAPEWSLQDQDGGTVKLASLRGQNVVLVFYPRDETSVCRAQLCEFRDAWEEVKARNTIVFGVNPQGRTSHSTFREKNRLPFQLLVDEGGTVCKAYNARGLFMTARTVYLIGPDGIIRYSSRGKPTVDEVLRSAA